MTSARDAILDSIRRSLRSDNTVAITTDKPAIEIQRHARGPQPHWQENNIERFVAKLEAVAATLKRVNNENEIIIAIQAYLQQQALPTQLVTAKSPLLDSLVWPADFKVEQRRATGDDVTVLTEAFAGVAETGSLVLLSSPESPTSLNFLPDNYLCVLQRDRIVQNIEDVWDRVRQHSETMPRAINFITGPSRTADVEQTIQLGAHGPRRLHVILLE
jgi:L-lactate dehydrogenase complex protein LldG